MGQKDLEDYNQFQIRRVTAAQQHLKNAENTDELLAVIGEWLKSVPPDTLSNCKREDLLSLPTLQSLRERLSTPTLSHWLAPFESRLEGRADFPDEVQTCFDVALALGTGRFFGTKPDKNGLKLVRAIFSLFPLAHAPFIAEAYQVVQSTPGAVNMLAESLGDQAETFLEQPKLVAWVEDVRILSKFSLHDEYKTFRGWKDRSADSIYPHDTYAYELLRNESYSDYLKVLDRFGHAAPIKNILKAVPSNIDVVSICDLLSSASCGVDSSDSWQHEAHTMVALLEFTSNYLLDKFGQADFDTRVSLVLDTFFQRDDAQVLGHGWLQELIWRDQQTRLSDLHPALARVAAELASRLNAMSKYSEWIQEEEEFWRHQRAIAAVAVLLHHGSTADIEVLLEEIFEKDLLHSARIPDYTSIDGFATNVISQSIASLQTPEKWLLSVWQKTFWQRERLRISSSKSNLQDSALVVITWSLLALSEMDSSDATTIEFWKLLENCTREIYITKAIRNDGDGWTIIQRNLAREWVRLFHNGTGSTELISLETYLSPYVRLTSDFEHILNELLKAGIDRKRLEGLGGGRIAISLP